MGRLKNKREQVNHQPAIRGKIRRFCVPDQFQANFSRTRLFLMFRFHIPCEIIILNNIVKPFFWTVRFPAARSRAGIRLAEYAKAKPDANTRTLRPDKCLVVSSLAPALRPSCPRNTGANAATTKGGLDGLYSALDVQTSTPGHRATIPLDAPAPVNQTQSLPIQGVMVLMSLSADPHSVKMNQN